VYCGKQEESANLAALGYGGLDVAGEEARWVGESSEAACAVAMVSSSSSSRLLAALPPFLGFGLDTL
jgi:hypothetical protein